MAIKPVGEMILLRRCAEVERTSSGLIVSGYYDNREYDVIDVGETDVVKNGDRIIVDENSCLEIEVEGEKLVLLPTHAILGVVC